MDTITWYAMGAHMQAWLDADSAHARDRLASVPAWFETWEERLSRFRPTSDVGRVNAGQGGWTTVSAVTWDVLGHALRAARDTDGLVSPLVQPALVAAGYDRPFEELGLQPASLMAPARPCTDWRELELRPRFRQVRLPLDAGLDFGGVGKGWAADRAARRLSVSDPVLVDAGGDIAISGPPRGHSGWPVGVADPFNPGSLLTTLEVKQGGVATSGRDYRRWTVAAHDQHHLIDPRSGAPADTDVVAVTIVASSVVRAEVAAKAVLILGSRVGLSWLRARPHLAGLIVAEDGEVLVSGKLQRGERQ